MRKSRGVPKAPKLVLVTKGNYNETMANVTVRNIPESLFTMLKDLARIERRSLNNEILVALEIGIQEIQAKIHRGEIRVPPEVRSAMLSEIAGKWKDSRSTARIIKDIVGSRTMGRNVKL
jgi:hypothetical protein